MQVLAALADAINEAVNAPRPLLKKMGPACYDQPTMTGRFSLSHRVKILSGFVLVALLITGLWHLLDDSVFRFPGLVGPAAPSVVRAESPTPASRYAGGSASRMAILLTDTDSGWLGLVQGLKSFGIPFTLTQDYQEALKHQVVMVYPVISGKTMNAEALRALTGFVQQGGTLVANQVLGGGLNSLFGFSQAVPSTARTRLNFSADNAFIARFFGQPELSIPIASPSQARGSYSYADPAGQVLARYDDGSAALITQTTGQGKTYALGLDLGAFSLLGYNNRQEGINTSYANSFQPGMDALFLLLRDIYVQNEPDAVLLGSVPDAKKISIVLTHDIDFTRSVVNASTYANYQKSQGIEATYFMQTKYVRDWNDDIFFNTEGAAKVGQLATLGMEIGSHSVAHSKVFSILPLGSGLESYPAYEPFVKSRSETRNATVLGELRISRYLLQATVPGLSVTSFRPGHLENPQTLPQALEAAGYCFSSSVTANNAMTHLPFRLNYNRRANDETGIFEFPITIEDELPPLMGSRLPQALDIAEKIQRYGGLYVVLTHPNILDHKLEFTRGLVEKMKPTAWFGTLQSFGQWWSARDRVSVDVSTLDGVKTVSLNAPETLAGLTLKVPAGWHLLASRPPAIRPVSAGTQVLLPAFKGELELQFSR